MQTIDDLTAKNNDITKEMEGLKADGELKEQRFNQMKVMQDKIENDMKKQITDLQSRIESNNIGRNSESEMYQESLLKTAQLDRTVSELEAKMAELNRENDELKHQLDLEHNTNKSEGSDRSNKVSSPLSDKTLGSSGVSSGGESDDESHHHHQTKQEAFIESGIFVEDDHASTSDNVTSPRTISASDNSTQTTNEQLLTELSELNEEIEKLTKFRDMVEARHTPNGSSSSSSGNPGEIRGVSDYESSEELDDLREECRELVSRKNSLEFEIVGYKGEIKTLKKKMEDYQSDQRIIQLERVEFSLRNQLMEWENKYQNLYAQNQMLLEEKCELEEADNDSRLNAQRWEQECKNNVEKSRLLGDELVLERKAMSMLRDELDQMQLNAEDSRRDSAYLEALVQRYEQRLFELEELEVELREKLTLLEQAFKVISWWNNYAMSTGTKITSLPMIVQLNSDENPKITPAIVDLIPATSSKNDNKADENNTCHENEMSLLRQEIKTAKMELSTTKGELVELKEKESAYQRTMQEAESIMGNVENKYQIVIKGLENDKIKLEERIQTLENNETRWRSNLKNSYGGGANNNNKSGDLKVTELLERLMVTEKSEIDLKEKVYQLEKAEREVNLKLLEQQKNNADIRSELMDQEDLVSKLSQYQKENDELSSVYRELQRKFQEIRTSEEFFRQRAKEMEFNETSIQDKLIHTEKTLEMKARKISELEKRIETHRDSSEREAMNQSGTQNKLRIEVEGLKSQVSTLKSEISAKSKEIDENEAEHRSEVKTIVSTTSPSVSPQPPPLVDCNNGGGGNSGAGANNTWPPTGRVRYRSLKDHNGRFFLVVKIR